ncbi:hypothetical protein N0V83_009294 [Neocucurbitaria cava]|uniref:Xylanolytic transcriptional activator regulatory domain-containing protein n=1 Tax=Neocucurbitaria cava TaxID=798079 RepID=A0A9W9CIZ6_9PLEO|nr:hypothetical protein N0V83_009294 [Neocucurbitaria cava]
MDDGDDMDVSLDGGTSKRAQNKCEVKSDRRLLTKRSEKKIDRIEDRLSGIENVLEALASKLGNLDLRGDSAESSSQSRSSRTGAIADTGTPAPFEGETTINSQSDYAREFLAQAVGSTPSIGHNAEVKSALAALEEHLEVAMSQLDMFMPANYENIMALLLGAAHAIELCKPSLCWTLISSAAGLSQNLGYHRINTMMNDTVQDRRSKLHVFWMIYMFDKTLSLRLGRASLIQDWDISLPFIAPGDEALNGTEGSKMLAYWVKVAQVQGQTYEKLFSPAAFLRSPTERTRVAVDLVDAMNMAWYERGDASMGDLTNFSKSHTLHQQKATFTANSSPNETEVPSKRRLFGQQSGRAGASSDGKDHIHDHVQGSFEKVQDIFFHADVVMHYSTCALIQRAVTPDQVTFNQECLESSRAALVAHMKANSQFNTKGNEELWSGYIHWSILQAPFTPFIVIFCNAIQKADSSDLTSLTDFVTSLESCRTVSEGADKLYKMCRLFLQVAKLYISAKRQDMTPSSTTQTSSSYSQNNQPNYYTTADGTQLDLNAMTEFDPYLSALGLVSNNAWSMAGGPNVPSASMGTAAFSQAPAMGGVVGPNAAKMGFGPPGGGQNSIQDWFSGSRYLMNLMEAGDDLQMPDLDL